MKLPNWLRPAERVLRAPLPICKTFDEPGMVLTFENRERYIIQSATGLLPPRASGPLVLRPIR